MPTTWKIRHPKPTQSSKSPMVPIDQVYEEQKKAWLKEVQDVKDSAPSTSRQPKEKVVGLLEDIPYPPTSKQYADVVLGRLDRMRDKN